MGGGETAARAALVCTGLAAAEGPGAAAASREPCSSVNSSPSDWTVRLPDHANTSPSGAVGCGNCNI